MNIVDMHCDTISELFKKRQKGKNANLLENDGHIDIKRLKKSGYILQNFAMFVEKEAQPDPWKQVMDLCEIYESEVEKNSNLIAKVLSFQDIEKNRKEGKVSGFLTVEEGGVCGGDIKKLNTLYEKGVRMMTLTWNYKNELGYPNIDKPLGKLVRERAATKPSEEANRMVWEYLNTPNARDGLTEMGVEFVWQMEEMGMIIDVSHMSDAGFYDVLKYTKNPFVASHSNARSLCSCVRNLNDDMIRKLADRGGVTGLNFCADFLIQLPVGVHNPGTVDAIVQHAKHIANIGGMECLGLGSDFDGIDTHEELPGAEAMDRLYTALQKGGFSESQIDMIFFKNVLRLYKEVLK